MSGLDWEHIGRTAAEARRTLGPADTAKVDQGLAALETSLSNMGIDMSDPAQARAVFMGATLVEHQLKASPLWPLFGSLIQPAITNLTVPLWMLVPETNR